MRSSICASACSTEPVLLLYFSIESLLLLLTVVLGTAAGGRASAGDYMTNLLVTLVPMTLPWGVMLCLRYLPAGLYFRSAAACGFTAVWLWVWPILVDAALSPIYGWHDGINNYTLATPFVSGWFWYAAAIVCFAAAALVLSVLGLRRHIDKGQIL